MIITITTSKKWACFFSGCFGTIIYCIYLKLHMYVYNSERENTYYKDACVAHSRQILATSFNIKYRLIFARNFPSNLYTHIHFTFFFFLSFNFLCLLFPPAWNFFFLSVSIYLFIHFVQSLLLGAPLIRVAFRLLFCLQNINCFVFKIFK